MLLKFHLYDFDSEQFKNHTRNEKCFTVLGNKVRNVYLQMHMLINIVIDKKGSLGLSQSDFFNISSTEAKVVFSPI
jgi:hypothetical protein